MVRLYIAVTDRTWFDTLSASPPDEVNFWRPSGGNQFRALQPGEIFLFKLHAPDNFIVGGGVFSHASNVPLSIAWQAFEQKNGAASPSEMRKRIAHYRKDPGILDPRQDPIIGCRVLTQPFFWPRHLWMPVPESWRPNIVSGKGFDLSKTEGLGLWQAVTERLAEPRLHSHLYEAPARYGAPHLIAPRLGQGAFRLAVTDGYERRCAVTNEKTLPILDAAHIRSYADGGEHQPSNGLLLRTDIHRLFDLGYVTVSSEGRFVVGRRLKDDFDNGKHYYELHGQAVRPPRSKDALPSPTALEWHRENRFLG
ncbi:HNH endonuclease [Inquilinus sp. NPDC058860]|uniref:HNH endonuclease n=1 Tax=Inquilinus sp. NPDC058860 TaxID=3346652 RepID=UPI0036A83B95